MTGRRLAGAGLAVVAALLLLLSAQRSEAADEAVEVQGMVAVYTARFDDVEQPGTAVVFALTSEQIYLVTATHVVRNKGRSPRAIELRFGGVDPAVRARLERFDDKGLDIAVLVVERRDTSGLDLAALPFDRLAPAGSVQRGDRVFVIGRRQAALSVSATPDRVSAVRGDRIAFESNFVVPGFSGGPLFNNSWQLLGLMLSDDPPEVEAVAFAAIVAKLKEWGLPLSLRPPYTQVSAGSHVSCRIAADGEANCWGGLQFDEMQLFDERLAMAGLRWRSVGVGKRHFCGIDDAGAAWCFGQNSVGQLGNGSTTPSLSSPVRVSGGLTFRSISVGSHTCGISRDDTAWCWGQGDYGQLGNDSNKNSPIPVQAGGALRFRSISPGVLHTCGVTTDGRAWCWGTTELAPLGVVGATRFVVHMPREVAGTTRFQSIGAGDHHTCALATDGSAWCWGGNDSGQVGNGSTSKRDVGVPVRVATERRFRRLSTGIAGYHNCALASDGAAFCWGANADGQLGDGSTTDRASPVAVTGGLKFVAISAGRFHTCAVTVDDVVWCWGGIRNDGLGVGAKGGSASPVRSAQ